MNTLLGTEAVCARLGIGRSTLLRWIGNKSFPAGLRKGRYVRWLESDVDAWIAQLSQQSAGTGVAGAPLSDGEGRAA